jgi:hypothetical protein
MYTLSSMLSPRTSSFRRIDRAAMLGHGEYGVERTRGDLVHLRCGL